MKKSIRKILSVAAACMFCVSISDFKAYSEAYLVGTGGLPGQDVIASALGTTTDGTEQSRIVDYLNNYCSGTYESLWKNGAYTSASTLFNHIIADITNNKPTVAHIYDTSASYWRYTTNGHYLCFEGYADDTTTNGHD